MSMKEAFDIFFKKNNTSWGKKYNTFPRVVKTNSNKNCGLFVSDEDEYGYIQWQPKIQTTRINFESLEKELGFPIQSQIKEFLNTYWFLRLRAKTDDVNQFEIDAITPENDLLLLARNSFNVEGYHYSEKGNYFLLGNFCEINGNDSYVIQVDNSDGIVYAVDVIEQKSIKIADSIEGLLIRMKGIWNIK